MTDPRPLPNPLPRRETSHGTSTLAAHLLVTAILLMLHGCGGGGGSADPATPPAPAPAPAPAPPAPPPSAGTRASCNLPNFEADMLEAVNARRRAGASCGSRGNFAPAPPLSWNAALTQAAIAHSDDMVARNFFSHTGSDGSSLSDRATRAGYAWRSLGENIAAGQSSVAIVVDGWMKSEGHCANIMNASFRDIGAACVAGNANTDYRSYWTQNFGLAR